MMMMLHLDKEKNATLFHTSVSPQSKRKGGAELLPSEPPKQSQRISSAEWGPTLEKDGPQVLIINDQEHLVSILLPQFAMPSTKYPSLVRKLYRW
jgi:hypothetical protein